MKYTLYIQSACSGCLEVIEFINRHQLDCLVKNIATDPPPIDSGFGIVLPALFQDQQLLAYGPDDILKILGSVGVK